MNKKKLEKIITEINPDFDAEASLNEIKKKIDIYEASVERNEDPLAKVRKDRKRNRSFIPALRYACAVVITAAVIIPTTMVIYKNNIKFDDKDLTHLFEDYDYCSVSSNVIEGKNETIMVFYGVKDNNAYLLYAHNSSTEIDFYVNDVLIADNARSRTGHTYLLAGTEDLIYEVRFGNSRIKSVFQTSYYAGILGSK